MKVKKISFFIVLSIAAICITATAYAYTHSDDDFKSWTVYGLAPWDWDKAGAHSEFYCSVQDHHATATAEGKTTDTVRVQRSAGFWAVAETSLVVDPVVHAYYGHD